MEESSNNIQMLSLLEERKAFEESSASAQNDLPIHAMKDEFIKAYNENQILIVVGETGCGKTTKLAQFIAESNTRNQPRDGFRIGCTQPRCVAAVSVATRVAKEVGCLLGIEVGYAIRFEDCTSNKTLIKYMTDGILLREALRDPTMKIYHTIIIDEAHERTQTTDILLGLLKKAAFIRSTLKIIITSATMDTNKFSMYFSNAPILNIPGRCHPVDIQYSLASVDVEDYAKRAVETVLQIHYFEDPGDILIFLTGQAEIEWACKALKRHTIKNPNLDSLLVLPVYSKLPIESLSLIFEPTPIGYRKVAIATNIAETSLTINGIRYVVDPGRFKQDIYEVPYFEPFVGISTLQVLQISRAQAKQRCGRAGRTGPGKCFRLYTESTYKTDMKDIQTPAIQRSCLASMILQLKAMGIKDILNFPFVDAPPMKNIALAIKTLDQLDVFDENGQLTAIGYQMAEFPIEPKLSHLLIRSVENGCSDEMLTISAMLSVDNVFFEPKDDSANIAMDKKKKFNRPEGDLLTLLNVYLEWKENQFTETWCEDNFIQYRIMTRALFIRRQLHNIMSRLNLELICIDSTREGSVEDLQKVICYCFSHNVAKKISGTDEKDGYRILSGSMKVSIHPSSSLAKSKPELVVFNELTEAGKVCIKDVTQIKNEWLSEWFDGNDLFYFEKLNKKKKGPRRQYDKSKKRTLHIE